MKQTEWCYDYHDPEKSYSLQHDRYPTPDEQKRFLKAYVQHRPHFSRSFPNSASATKPGQSSSISSFMLDNRSPPAQCQEDEARREEATEAEVERLMRQTRLWRVANSAQWVAWGIVQAKIPSTDESSANRQAQGTPTADNADIAHEEGTMTPRASDSQMTETIPAVQDALERNSENLKSEGHAKGDNPPEEAEEEEEFDYLAYAQERAMFFWGDVLQLGIVKEEDLPADLFAKVKTVEY